MNRQKPETAGEMVFSIDAPDDLMGLIRYGRDAIERKKMESLLYVWEKLLDRHWRIRIRFGRKGMWFVYKPHGREATSFSNRRFEKLSVLGDGRVEMECGSERRWTYVAVVRREPALHWCMENLKAYGSE